MSAGDLESARVGAHTRSVKRIGCLVAALLAPGCASGDDPATSATSFGTATPTATATATATTGTPSGSTSGEAASSEASTDPDPTAEDTTATTGDGTTGAAATGSTTESPTTDSGEPDQQPDDGMYSACVSVVDCIGLTTCLTATDTSGSPIEPFCTAGSCNSPLAQCDPTPGGTAVPICLPVDLGGTMDTVCALDCSVGECPAGMQCRVLAEGSICS